MSDDPSVFLRPAADRSMQDQTRMFDSKKWVWIAHDEEGFVAAQVKGQKGDSLTIEMPDGQVGSARLWCPLRHRMHSSSRRIAD